MRMNVAKAALRVMREYINNTSTHTHLQHVTLPFSPQHQKKSFMLLYYCEKLQCFSCAAMHTWFRFVAALAEVGSSNLCKNTHTSVQSAFFLLVMFINVWRCHLLQL